MATRRYRSAFAAAMFSLCLASMCLLAYVGYAEARRTLFHFEVDKVVAEAGSVQAAVEKHLQASLPLDQFAGFEPLARGLMASDPGVVGMLARDAAGAAAFRSGHEEGGAGSFRPVFQADGNPVSASPLQLRVLLPLRDKFEPVGTLAILIDKTRIENRTGQALNWFLAVAAALSAVYGLFAFRYAARSSAERTWRLRRNFLIGLLVLATVILGNLWPAYVEGAQGKATGIARALSERLGTVLAAGISLSDIDGIDQALAAYRQANPDLAALALLEDGKAIIHTDPAHAGQDWQVDPKAIEYVEVIPGQADGRLRVAVSLPHAVVESALLANARNFAAIILAVGLLAWVALGIANAALERDEPGRAASQFDLESLQGVFFLSVFVDNLSASFLPQLMHAATAAGNLPPTLASLAFMGYFLAFAVALLLAGKLVGRLGPRALIVVGALLVLVGAVTLTLSHEIVALAAARVVSGCGQGLLFVGVQSFIIATTDEARRTRGNGIIVFGFNGGMIAGIVTGSLLAVYLGERFVFSLAAGLSLVIALFARRLLADVSARSASPAGEEGGAFLRALRDPDFMRALLLVGVPSKAVMTGVIVFALPLLLTRIGFGQDEIGQIVMFYAAGVMASNSFVVRLVDRRAGARSWLFRGMLVSAVGVALIGASGLFDEAWTQAHLFEIKACLLAGIALIGIAHGAINAPVMDLVARSQFAVAGNPAQAAAIYRFAERVGHLAGPLLVGLLIQGSTQGTAQLLWVGGALAVLATLFLIRGAARQGEATCDA